MKVSHVFIWVLCALLGCAVPGLSQCLSDPVCPLCPLGKAPPVRMLERPGYVVGTATAHGYCSGTVIACEGDKSLVVTCNHCYGRYNPRKGDFDRGAYPLPVTVTQLSTGKSYESDAVDGDPLPDCALVVVPARLPCVSVSTDLHSPGDLVEHWGITSRYTSGRVLWADTSHPDYPASSFGSSLSSIPGDSGAGILSDGKLVAVNWGYDGRKRQCGTLARYVADVARRSPVVCEQFPLAVKEWGGAILPAPMPKLVQPPPAIPAPIPYSPPQWERRPLFPRLRYWLGA